MKKKSTTVQFNQKLCELMKQIIVSCFKQIIIKNVVIITWA